MKVAIVGGAKSSQMQAPFNNEEWEIWVLGNQITDYNGKRVSRIFELHDNLDQHPSHYPQFLVDLGVKMVVGDKFPVVAENVEIFPYQEADDLIGSHYQTSSASYMMAYAILYGATEVAVYGINMAVNDHEFFKQKACFEMWVGYAMGRGIKVHIPESSPILKSSYDEARDWNNRKKSPFFEEALINHALEHERVAEHLKMKMWKHEGAKEVYESLAKVARGVDCGMEMELLEINDKL